jgi:uncharacterized membrane protein
MKLAQVKVGVLPENIAGGIAYMTFLPAIALLLRAPYSRNRFVRFHCFQCLWLWAACLLTALALRLIALIVFPIPRLGPYLVLLLTILAGLAAIVIWLVLVVKALQGEMFALPIVGQIADQQAGPTESNLR